MTEEQSNDIINALKRLERVGDRASKTNEKLRNAVHVVAGKIIKLFPADMSLPRRLKIIEEQDADPQYGPFYTLVYHDPVPGATMEDGTGWKDYPVSGGNVGTIYRFADDLANGLMDELANWLEEWNASSEQKVEIVEKLAKKKD